MVKSSGYLKLTGGPYGKNQSSLSHQEREDFQSVMTKDSDSESNQETSQATSDQNSSQNEEDNFILSKRPEKVLDKLPLRRNPENMVNISRFDHGVSVSKVPEKPNIDGFNWRKYGQKLVRGNSFVRSYYKCTYSNCPARKQVERSHDGNITEINYLSKHHHPKPLQNQPKGSDYFLENVLQSNEVESETNDIEREPKRQKKENDGVVMKTNYEPHVVVETRSAVDIVNDGYRWRKYGQKTVKGNPNPRSYYRCSNPGCPVKKHVERAARDEKIVITTYEGRHDHDMPHGARTVTQNMKDNNNGTTSHNDDDDDDDDGGGGGDRRPRLEANKSTTCMEMVVYGVR